MANYIKNKGVIANMKPKFNYEHLKKKYIDAAVDLVLSAYSEEKRSVPFLPAEEEVLRYLQESVKNLFENGEGIVALCDNKLVGFLAGFQVDELFGKCKGIYIPLYGQGAVKEYRSSLYQDLYRHAADLWVKKSYMSHAITCFAHDKETVDTWFWLGFGNRCVDAICEVAPKNTKNSDIIIHKAQQKDISSMANLNKQLTEHLNQSPLFMPRYKENPMEDLSKCLEKNNHHMWVALKDDKPLGYMHIEPSGENFVSEHESVMNIRGAYVLEDERKSGIGAMLLGEIQQWLMQNGYPLCGVDFESFNIVGSRFWTKHFTPYTYSLVRRIDERIVNFKK